MKRSNSIRCLFVDIGGVLLTNGWDHRAQKNVARSFDLDLHDMQARHHLTFDTYEEGRLTMDEYLNRIVFYRKRPFSRAQFKKAMFAQSKPYPQMLKLMRDLKKKFALKVVAVSNEGRELNAHRISAFQLTPLFDVFISSCYVNVRKPDTEIFSLAFDVAQQKPDSVIYIENTAMFVQIAENLGVRSVLHTDYASTRKKLAAYGLPIDEAAYE